MKIRELTGYVIVGFIVAIFIYDGYAYIQGGQDATISSVIITDWALNYPAFTFAMGFIMGHLFWPLSKKKGIPDGR